jgi:hypothetical protein
MSVQVGAANGVLCLSDSFTCGVFAAMIVSGSIRNDPLGRAPEESDAL